MLIRYFYSRRKRNATPYPTRAIAKAVWDCVVVGTLEPAHDMVMPRLHASKKAGLI